jgi:ABC-type sugar transport system, permease component
MEISGIKQSKLSSNKRREKIANVLSFVLLVIIAAFVMLPIWWIFRSSLMTNGELYGWPPAFFPSKWLFSNYVDTVNSPSFNFFLLFGNTMKIVVPAVLGGTLTATLCGYAFARLRFRGKKPIFMLCIGSMLLPSMVTLIPLYVMWAQFFHLADTYWPLIIPYFTGGGAFSIYLINQFIRTIPRELDEAATIDGAGPMQILFKIIVPAIKPAMIVVGLFIFIALWNDLLQQTVYINSPDKFTIAIGISMFRSALKADWAKIMCATCLSFVPGVVIFLFGQRYFVEGIVMTGMKN